jgi:hypothetical protein
MTCKTAKTFNGTFGFIEIMQTELLVNYSTSKQSIVVENMTGNRKLSQI